MRQSYLVIVGLLLVAGCTDLRTDYPLLPVKEYEKMIVGRFDADYVGNEQCLKSCHKHDKILKNFNMSVHSSQVDANSGLPLVNCESCHGPGSLAIANIKEDRCDKSTFLHLSELPPPAQSLICLKCHSVASTPALYNWNGSIHANSGVSCMECHKLHQGPQQKVSRHDMAELCYKCHASVRAEFSLTSHHPVDEHKVTCDDCHDPHDSTEEHNLKYGGGKELCTRCHMEYQGPFVYEHADVTESCTNCHRPHGSANNPLLNTSQPALCLQCHTGHFSSFMAPALSTDAFKSAFYTRCTDCHSAIHGTDIPSYRGEGSLISR